MSNNTKITLTPTFIVYLNGSRFSIDMETDVKEIIINENVDRPSTFSIKLADEMRKWTDSQDLAEGAEIKIMLGYKDAVEEVMNGEVTAITPSYRKGADDQVVIKGCNHMHRLNRGNKTRSFNEMTDTEIVQQIADEAGLASNIENLGNVRFFTVQKNYTDYEYLRLMAKRNNCRVWSKNSTLYFKRASENAGEDIILEWGKTLIDFNPRLNSQKLVTEVEVRGWDRERKEPIVESATINDITLKVGGDTLGSTIVEQNFQNAKMIYVDRKIQDANGALQTALDLITTNSMKYITAKGSCQGNNKMHAGMIIEAKELGNRFSGHYYATTVQHKFTAARGYNTKFELMRNAT